MQWAEAKIYSTGLTNIPFNFSAGVASELYVPMNKDSGVI